MHWPVAATAHLFGRAAKSGALPLDQLRFTVEVKDRGGRFTSRSPRGGIWNCEPLGSDHR